MKLKMSLLQLTCYSCIISLAVLKVEGATGLGDEFQPSVDASCTGGTMSIRVHTTQPFEGVIHSPNRTEPGCSIFGGGGLKTKLEIDLNRPEGSYGSCGVKYNTQTEETRVAIFVRAHPTIELLEDRLYIVKCGKAGFRNTRDERSYIQLKVTDGVSKVNAVLEGSDQYKLQLQVLNPDPEFGILVKRCFAFDNADTSLQLVNDRGCRDQRLISEFRYNDASSTAEADIYSMFRLPHSNRTYFQCDVEICRGACEKPVCELTRQTTDSDSDPFQKTEADDTVTTSTSVFVAEPGSVSAVGLSACSGSINPTWLTYLCIAFGVLFAIMLLINIFLCSAMTCSCTKTEVIEKEPSIYDDYDYDSQYGYASKVYSESDYGSELGGVEDQRRHQVPSEAGTLHSKYSRGDNTLNRSRNGGSRYLE